VQGCQEVVGGNGILEQAEQGRDPMHPVLSSYRDANCPCSWQETLDKSGTVINIPLGGTHTPTPNLDSFFKSSWSNGCPGSPSDAGAVQRRLLALCQAVAPAGSNTVQASTPGAPL
jgi:hypothetical protein